MEKGTDNRTATIIPRQRGGQNSHSTWSCPTADTPWSYRRCLVPGVRRSRRCRYTIWHTVLYRLHNRAVGRRRHTSLESFWNRRTPYNKQHRGMAWKAEEEGSALTSKYIHHHSDIQGNTEFQWYQQNPARSRRNRSTTCQEVSQHWPSSCHPERKIPEQNDRFDDLRGFCISATLSWINKQ
jgi:hypothetical protein